MNYLKRLIYLHVGKLKTIIKNTKLYIHLLQQMIV